MWEHSYIIHLVNEFFCQYVQLDPTLTLTNLIPLFWCTTIKLQDIRGNATYTRDEAGFLVVNFRHKLPRMVDPFIFPS